MRGLLLFAALHGLLSIVAGTIAAHFLADELGAKGIARLETGARYQMYHAVAMLAAALWLSRSRSKLLTGAGWLWGVGAALFAGALYALALSGVKSFGHVAPFGGMCMLAGWLMLGVFGVRVKGKRG